MRRAGILLHPTSLPGPYGMGDIGPSARQFLEWLDAAGQHVWQLLPLVPVGGTGSPYSSPSAFARNPLLLSLDDLAKDGWLSHAERPWATGDRYRVDYDDVIRRKQPALTLAADRVRGAVDLGAWAAERAWVADWALNRAIAVEHGADWRHWPEPLRDRHPEALAEARDRHHAAHDRTIALQWLFAQQWARLRAEAQRRGVALWGDIPIFVSGDSCDVWAHRDLFRLDGLGFPEAVSGVPPDAFSALGQLWGHPLFAVPAHRATGHAWWVARIASLLELVDAVRIDHFRGLDQVWEVPAGAADAREGQWVDSFGPPLLDALAEALGDVPLIAEDLGIITPEVHALRDRYELPGMAILQFAFAGLDDDPAAANPYLPHNHRRDLVVYTGTHDNDTTLGWYASAPEAVREHVRRYLGSDGRDLPTDLLRAAYRSVADTVILPMQDALGLDGRARMNVPGEADGNWSWRMGAEAMNLTLARKLRLEAALSARLGLPA